MSRGPAIPPSRQKDATAEKSREQIEIWQGNRGNKLDRVVTYRDLVKYRLGSLSQGGQFQVGDVINPPATYVGPLFNLTAAGGFGIIFLDWEGTNQTSYSYTEIWRSSDDNLGNAVLLATTRAGLYPDPVSDGVGYYYWVRAVSTTGNPGPFNDTAGTYAQSTLAPGYIIDQIQGLISESELAAELLTPIQAIPSIQTTLSDHGGRIASTEAALSDLLNISVYNTSTDYAVDDLVSYNDRAWRALVAMTAPAPTPVEGANWTEVGNYATFSDLIAANAVAIDDLDVRVTANGADITSNATDITALGVRVTDTESDLAANTSAIGTLDSRVTVVEGTVTANSSDITLLQSDLTTAQDDISGNSTALNLLDSRVTTAEGAISANSSDITQLQADVQALDVDGNAAALQALDVRVTANEQDITAIASDVTTLTASVGDNTAAIETKAEASAVQSLDGEVTDIKAQYTIKLDVNGRVSGIGLMNDGSTSEFIVSSDAVYFIDPGQSIAPFDPNTNYSSMDALRDTQFVFGYATVEGFQRFAINVPAYIPELTITNAMIKDAVITGAKIANASIGGAKINIAEIWDLSIGDLIRSNNYVADSSGWIIRRSGNAEFNNVIARGHIEAESGYIASTLQIGGTGRDFGELVQMAENADTSLFENWIRPGTTLIDGNKIFTGDAYVDTLQIKGQAVTFPRGAHTGGGTSAIGSSWVTVQSLTLFGATGAPLIIDFCCAAQAQGNATMDIRLLVAGSQRFYGDDVLARYARGFDGFGGLQYESRGLPAFTYYYASPPSGTVSVVVQIRFTGASGNASSRSLSVMEAKR
ncbi:MULTISPECIES: phage tail tip fiber protein [unclassified Marinobacter]|uniref:phage tail tip fiber protein n=1 Tax=unclassified Marinobacter TaxID=83889 RepID=UPI001926BBA3|nr:MULTISPECIES: hypothetical protein [unclassified Marinobacter]MBL3825167.1 hypothetical protein [Marinobacter sp. MC3]MBL3893629.1 hypothetical protein [Marinobacter sp. MW3]